MAERGAVDRYVAERGVTERGTVEADVRHGITTTAEGPVAWALYGELRGDRVPVVALHGVTDSGACWEPVLAGWAAERAVLTVDARGHGGTPLPADGRLAISAVARDVAAAVREVVRDVVGPRVVAVGHSMGGLVAEELALADPGLVAGLVLEDPAWNRGRDLDAAGVPTWLPPFVASFAGATQEQLEARSRRENAGWPDAEHAPWAASKRQVDPRLGEGPHEWDERDWVPALAEVQVPVLLVTGDVDRGAIVDDRLLEGARAALGDRLTHVAVPSAGHSVRREAPAAFLEAVDAFLRQVDRAAG